MSDREPTEPSLRARLATPRWLLPPVIAAIGIVLIVVASGTVAIVGGGLVAVALIAPRRMPDSKKTPLADALMP